MTAARRKTLREELPHEAVGYDSVRELLDLEVIERHDGCLPGKAWPGPQQNVMWWFTLENGKRVGWNENPSTGWSFPVLGKARAGGAVMAKTKIFTGLGIVAGRQYPMAMRSTSAVKVATALSKQTSGVTGAGHVRAYWSTLPKPHEKLDAALDRFPPETLIMSRKRWPESPDDWEEIPR